MIEAAEFSRCPRIKRMALAEYRRKRSFAVTPEPVGSVGKARGRSFVVQKHQARQLHYDFRLELDGFLKSWAVPKGPSLDTEVKRLAMQVEDHPVEYGAFEGVIPQGQYGGGTVMLWDRGRWEPIGDAHEGYTTGRLKFVLHGKKLRGRWMLVRTARPDRQGAQRQWLLFKERDAEAKPHDQGDVLEQQPLSVATGRTMEQIAAARDRVWDAKSGESAGAKRSKAPPARTKLAADYDQKKLQFAGVRLTSPDKLLYPDSGITKLELANYFKAAAPWMLPHLQERPLVLLRGPDGHLQKSFYQKHPGKGTDPHLQQLQIAEGGKAAPYLWVKDEQGLIALAQMAALEIHAWGSRIDQVEKPDRLTFDLDPDAEVSWSRVVQSARQIREFLQGLQLESFLKATGGKGLHLVVPIARRHDWEECKAFCKLVADAVVRADSARYTANPSLAARRGKIYLDYLRNARGATAIVPYSTRARFDAPIAVPLAWRELTTRRRGDSYTLRTIGKRLATLKRDPWEGIAKLSQSLAPAKAILAGLLPGR